ncbi:MAG: hypothetical protein BGO49_11845 [Planctomycetales bacterium 71-10]|nr:MAG: hypothetical protein BGO49_11845 [Planctomycetales bacterium 71-10]
MTPRRAKVPLLAPRLWAALSATALALAWGVDARAGCVGRSHPSEQVPSAVVNLSAEIFGESSAPLRPAGCTGAFCGKPSAPTGMDSSGGVDLRVESWACCTLPPSPDRDGGSRLIAESDDPSPATQRDALVEPPR